MRNRVILVVGYACMTQTAYQIQMLHQLGAEVINIDPYGKDGRYSALSWQQQRITWQGYDISPERIDAVLVCALTGEIPGQQAFDQTESQALNWDTWFQHYGMQRDRSDTLLSLMLAYERAAVPVFNPSSCSQLSRRKPFQISVLQQTGCLLPTTLVSNDPQQAAAFIKQQGDCIIKPAAGGSLTLSANTLLEQGQLEKLCESPAIIQQRIFGDDLRVIVVDGEVCSCARVKVAEGSIDFRGEAAYQCGQTQYEAVQLPKQVVHQCQQITAALGLRFAGIDIKRTKDGQCYFLECNSSPIYLDVENKLGHPITQTLCHALMQR